MHFVLHLLTLAATAVFAVIVAVFALGVAGAFLWGVWLVLRGWVNGED